MTTDDRIRLIRIKIERADKHIEDLEDVVGKLVRPVFKIMSIQHDPHTGMPFLESKPLDIYSSAIPLIAGDAVHNLRSALDHLAFQLVSVGIESGIVRKGRMETIQFPIVHDAKYYESRKARYIEGARVKAIEAIDRLKPYRGGNEPLWLLHKMDIADKHTFILAIGQDFIMDGSFLKASDPFFTSLQTPKTKKEMDLTTNKSFVEPAVGRTNALIETLHKLRESVSNIVTSFLPFLE